MQIGPKALLGLGQPAALRGFPLTLSKGVGGNALFLDGVALRLDGAVLILTV